MEKALYWFTNDLRLQDNPSLCSLLQRCDQIAFIHVVDPRDFYPGNHQHRPVGEHRWRFICESLMSLGAQLKQLGHPLIVLEGDPATQIARFTERHQIGTIGCARQTGWYEQLTWSAIQQAMPGLNFISQWNSTLFEPEQLELTESSLASFSKFRKQVEKNAIEIAAPCDTWPETPPGPVTSDDPQALSTTEPDTQLDKGLADNPRNPLFEGGEQAALEHIEQYFSSPAPASYKQTRNALDGWENSTKFSPWLASGNVSPRFLWQRLKRYEAEREKNGSTYWIGFELLWREYFQWLAILKEARLFTFQGSASRRPLTSYYSERFTRWTQGNTPWPLVNACMRQLNATGYMSNRGRQIAASCLVNELSVDWRYGAAYFQQQLVDHDVASNWGNWQYIAGVGADTRGGRHFHLQKQTEMHDPDGTFIDKWQGSQDASPLDSVDAADWPISPLSRPDADPPG